jgi:hypothetical protein
MDRGIGQWGRLDVVVGTLALRVEVDGKKGRRGGSSRKNS